MSEKGAKRVAGERYSELPIMGLQILGTINPGVNGQGVPKEYAQSEKELRKKGKARETQVKEGGSIVLKKAR